MRKVRKSLINKPPGTKADVPLEEALNAREKNMLGDNGLVHGQDRYLARAKAGDVVLPTDQLSPEILAKLEKRIGSLAGRIIGQGGELAVSDLQLDGLAQAEESDMNALLELGEHMHQETSHQHIPLDLERL